MNLLADPLNNWTNPFANVVDGWLHLLMMIRSL